MFVLPGKQTHYGTYFLIFTVKARYWKSSPNTNCEEELKSLLGCVISVSVAITLHVYMPEPYAAAQQILPYYSISF